MRISESIVLPALVLCVFTCSAGAQPASPSGCTLDPPVFTTGAPNIFNDQQEQDLGDALAEFFEPQLHLAPPSADDQLTRIGERLLATLPPTGLHYRFRIYDSGEINAYSLSGGRVYVSRKLITSIKNEDALAGVVAHEIGHISTHQLAIVFTRNLRIRLGVTQVTDRADIFARVHQFFSTPAKSSEEAGRETKNELVADHVALYAMVRAGYAAESFSSFLDESTINKGKTGNWLSDAFGLTHESSQRYRNALKLIDDLPSGCKQKQPSSNAAFKAWLENTVDERVKSFAEGVTGDRPLTLESPLRPALEHIRFSPDGRYLLAQDEGGISVADKEAGKTLFRIDAPEVEAAQFTLDSKNIVFHDKNLRVERWSLATGQRASVKELVVFDGCDQSQLSPDGKTLICVNRKAVNGAPGINLRLFDVESGQQFFEKPNYFELYDSGGTYYFSNPLFISAYQTFKLAGPMRLEITPNGKYLLAVMGSHALAYDLELRQPVELQGKLKGLKQARMAFLGPDKLFVVGDVKDQFHYHAEILSFPDGRLLGKTQIGNYQIEAATNGHYLITHSDKDNVSQILDPVPEKYLVSSKHPSLDVWDQTVVAEDATGGLAVGQIGLAGEKQIALPLGALPIPRAAVFSLDGKYLALSLKSRAEIWELETGKKIGLIRPFQSAWMDEADSLYGQFPKIGNNEPSEIKITFSPMSAREVGKLADEDWQYRDLQLKLKPMGNDKITYKHATLEVKKMETQEVAWTREFPRETPAFWNASGNRMVLGWDMSNDAVDSEIKQFPELLSEFSALKDKKKGLLIETVVAETGAPLKQVIIPSSDLSRGWNDQRRVTVSGEYVLARGEHGNTEIYRMENGAKVGEFFGSPLAADAATGLVAATNREDEILLVDMQNGKEIKRFSLGSPVRAARILSSNEKLLLVLTADQVVHRLELPK